MNSLTKIDKNKVVTDSRDLEDVFGIEHRSIYRLVSKHEKKLGEVRFEIASKDSGQRQKYAILTERQAMILLTYTRSNEKTDAFRQELVDDFISMRTALREISLNKSNQQWLSNRDQGKLVRKETTDIIKEFTDYAISQGSQNAKRYYGNISKMENSALFLVMQKFPNLRDVMNNRQLNIVQAADTIVQEAIREGMEKELFYKDIYQLAKTRVNNFAEYMPRTSIPMSIEGE